MRWATSDMAYLLTRDSKIVFRDAAACTGHRPAAPLRRFPTLRLAVPPAEVEFRSSHLVHGVVALPVTW